jgi:nuclear pore complex protein Nup155
MSIGISSRVNIIAGTDTGRIFFGGYDDADVHELLYQQEEKWFTSRCYQVNHSVASWSALLPAPADFLGTRKSMERLQDIVVDDTRNLVYTLSDKSTIRTYHMDGPQQLTKVVEKGKMQSLRDTSFMTQTPSPLLTDQMRIVSICPISANESSRVYLMAVTSTGCRLFLSATNASSYMLGSSSKVTAPQNMQVQFIKFPPPENSRGQRLADGGQAAEASTDLRSRLLEITIRGQRFAPGFFVDVVRKDGRPDADLLFFSAPDAGKIKHASPLSALKLFEQANWVDDGTSERVLDVTLASAPFAASDRPLGFGNELAVQFDRPPTDIAILTNTGIKVIRRRRFVDIFAAVIRSAAGEEGLEKEMRRFTTLYGRVESVSAALAVACGQGVDQGVGGRGVVDQATQDRARQAFIDYGGKPTVSESEAAQITTSSVRLSARHDALALYLGRLIRQVWNSPVAMLRIEPNGGLVIRPRVPVTKLASIQENIEQLRRFLQANRGTIQGLSGPSDLQRMASRQEEVALQAEHQALFALQKLMESVSEGISFVQMLFEERVADVYARLDEDSRTGFRELKFQSLFTQPAGKNLAKVLVKAIVNRNIESGANVETVADALRRRCGSFCSPNDVVIFKAQEQLQRATEQIGNPVVLRTLLNESLRLFERVASSLTFVNLQGAVDQFVDLRYFAGAIQLCLVVAREKDRGNTSLSWINDGRPENDPRAQTFRERKSCYDLVHDVLRKLDQVTTAEPELIDGRPTLAATKRVEAYNVVNDSDDEVFHVDLYEWYIEQGWTDRILAVESPHAITFLQRLASQDARHAELLCRFYTHRSRFFEAARVQADLARSSFAIGIKDRITLLSRAKGNASVSTSGVSRQDQQLLNHEVAELLEVAHIQDDLLERLRADVRIPAERKVEVEHDLDGQILDLSDVRA